MTYLVLISDGGRDEKLAMRAESHKFSANARQITGIGSVAAFLFATAMFRSSQNAFETTFAPIGHDLLHLTPSVIGIGVTVSGVITVLGNFILASRVQRRNLLWVLIAGLVAMSSASAVIGFSESVMAYFISAILLGIAGGLVMPALTTFGGHIRGIQPNRSLTAFTLALTVSLALGPLLESWVLSLGGNSLKTAILIFAPFGIIAILFAVWVVRTGLVGWEDQRTSSVKISVLPGKLMESVPLRLAIIGQLINQVPFVTIISFGALIGHSLYGATPAQVQLSFTAFFTGALVTRTALVIRPPSRHKMFLLKLSAFLMLAGIAALGLGSGLLYFFVIMTILGMPHGLLFPLTIGLIAKGTKASDLPRANAVLFTSINFVSVLFPILIGFSLEGIGYRFSLLWILLVVAGLSYMLLRISRTIAREQIPV